MIRRQKKEKGKRGPAPLYPWDSWFKRKRPFSIYRHRDFECQPHAMAAMFRTRASERGTSVSITIEEDMLTIQVGAYD